ncbi:hypothetical protein BH11MYX4_BH11MYX4_01780 [soil metagenome]
MRALGITAFVAALALPFGCAEKGETQVVPPVVLGMLETAAPTYDDGQMQIYEAYLPVELPLRRPSDDERPKGESDPYPRPPFQLASDTRITARFTISNLEDKPHVVELLLNPWNEFVRYEPGVTVDNEATTPNFSGINGRYILPPLGRIEGIITPDDFVELAADLGTAMKLQKVPPAADSQFAGPALYNRAFNVQNRSSQPDLVLAPFIPRVVANIVGFNLGLRSYEPSKVAVEVVLDVEDVNGDRVIPVGADVRRVGRPGTVLSPPAVPMRP